MHNETVVIKPIMFFDENRHENSWSNEFKQIFAKYWTVLLKGGLNDQIGPFSENVRAK